MSYKNHEKFSIVFDDVMEFISCMSIHLEYASTKTKKLCPNNLRCNLDHGFPGHSHGWSCVSSMSASSLHGHILQEASLDEMLDLRKNMVLVRPCTSL